MLLKRTRVFSSDACVLYSSVPPGIALRSADESAPGSRDRGDPDVAIKAYRGPNGAFECGRIYRVYEFRLGNNVRVTYSRVVNS